MNNKIKILAVGGATATGKSALAIRLAKKLNGEIVSCDSMQVYIDMDIGTAKPTADECEGITHHMLDVCSPTVNYSSADWAEEAVPVIEDISARGKLPIVCGGTGMYLDSLLRPSHFSEVAESSNIRAELQAFAKNNGVEALHEKLREVDSASAEAIHPNNVKRVIRALEIYMLTGKTKTEHDLESVSGESKYDSRIITVDYEDRSTLYLRIERRVDEMMSSGLLNEVKRLAEDGMLSDGTTASQAIGYKEILLYLRGEISIESAVDLIKKNTRNYAKRQITWFSRYKDISVVPDHGGAMRSSDELADEVIERLHREKWL